VVGLDLPSRGQRGGESSALVSALRRRWRLLADALAVAFMVTFAMHTIPTVLAAPGLADAEAYWMVKLADPYAGVAGHGGTFLYSPVIAQLLWPFTFLPREVFYGLMMVANLAALSYLVTPVGAAVALFIPWVSYEVAEGNIHLLLAAALVAGMQRPWLWSVFPLTKVTPAVVFGYRFWKPLVATLAISFVSFVFAPSLWFEWVDRLLATNDGSVRFDDSNWTTLSLGVRMVAAVAIVALARWRRRPALLPIALLLSIPLPWARVPVVLLAIPRMWIRGDESEPARG
jgi:hypothetical protein